jgi:hypothetical protein
MRAAVIVPRRPSDGPRGRVHGVVVDLSWTGVSPGSRRAFQAGGPMTALSTAFVSLFAFALAAPAEPIAGQERIESVALAGSGNAGTIVTTPVLLGGDRTAYQFGRGRCKSHKLETAVVEQIMTAMRARAPVRIDATTVGEDRCVTAITFFAPDA